MVTEEWEKGPENVKGEAARWWKISLQTSINNSDEDKNLWLQSARAAKKSTKGIIQHDNKWWQSGYKREYNKVLLKQNDYIGKRR